MAEADAQRNGAGLFLGLCRPRICEGVRTGQARKTDTDRAAVNCRSAVQLRQMLGRLKCNSRRTCLVTKFMIKTVSSVSRSCSWFPVRLKRKPRPETLTQPAAKPAVKEAQYDTGRTAFQRMYRGGARCGRRMRSRSDCSRSSRRMRRRLKARPDCGARRLPLRRGG